MQQDRGRAYVFTGLLAALAACSGLEPAPSQSEPTSGAGGTGVFLHGEAACGNSAGTSAAGSSAGATGGTSSLPSDFGSGGSSGSSSSSPDGGKASTSSTGGTGGDEPLGESGAGGAGEPESPLGHALLFTEYVEGSSSYKAVEISALEDSTLEGCRVATYFNGATSANGAALEGVLLEGESVVVCSSALAEQGAVCSRTAGLTFNGDDAVALECDGVLIDVIGQIGLDPGAAWGAGDVSTVDHTLRRRCDATADSDPTDDFEPSAEWLGFPQDSFEDLGQRDCSGSGAAGAGGEG
jgi:hypothetical protein